jgi:hypothetical protein
MKNTPFHLLQWQWDILGGLEAETCIRGNYDSAVYTVQSNQVIIPSSKGGGKVHHVRGVWLTSIEFTWEGYWAGVKTPGAVNYFTGGSAQNSGDQTVITLGTGLANETQVQVYYYFGSGTFFKADTPVEAYPAFFNAWQGEDRYKFSSAPDGDQWIALAMLEARARWEDFKHCYGWSLMESLEKFAEDPDYSMIEDFNRDAARDRENTKGFYSGCDGRSTIQAEIEDNKLKVQGNVAAAGWGYWGEGRKVNVPPQADYFKFLFKGQASKKSFKITLNPHPTGLYDADYLYVFGFPDFSVNWRLIQANLFEFVKTKNIIWDGDRRDWEIWGAWVNDPRYGLNYISLSYDDIPDHVENGYHHQKALRADMGCCNSKMIEGSWLYSLLVIETDLNPGVPLPGDFDSTGTENINFLYRLYSPYPGIPNLMVEIRDNADNVHWYVVPGDFIYWERVTLPWSIFGNQPITHPIKKLSFNFSYDGLWETIFDCSAHLDDIKFGNQVPFTSAF